MKKYCKRKRIAIVILILTMLIRKTEKFDLKINFCIIAILPPSKTVVSVNITRLFMYIFFVLFWGSIKILPRTNESMPPRNSRYSNISGKYRHMQLIIAPKPATAMILFCVTVQERNRTARFHTQSNNTKFKRKKYSK